MINSLTHQCGAEFNKKHRHARKFVSIGVHSWFSIESLAKGGGLQGGVGPGEAQKAWH
jgi:hypothetical protein